MAFPAPAPAPAPWIPVEPNKNPDAILGPLPIELGSVALLIPPTVVPAGATGILVFAWAKLSGMNPRLAYWHIGADAGGKRDFFSLLVGGDPTAPSIVCNSQAFWLPMPSSRKLVVTLHVANLSAQTQGEVEIHGYMPRPSGS